MKVYFDLEKVIEKGTWRYLGQRCDVKEPYRVPIGGISIAAIQSALDGTCFRIGRVNTRNAFVVVSGAARFLYVRPEYTCYRRVALRVFPTVPWAIDFDHALAKNIALKATPPLAYVLLLRIPPGVNRGHGLYEKRDQLPAEMPLTCFADSRIWDKWLGRSPKMWNRSETVMAGYSPTIAASSSLGLTLKQLGKWAYAIGMAEEDLPFHGLTEFQP